MYLNKQNYNEEGSKNKKNFFFQNLCLLEKFK